MEDSETNNHGGSISGTPHLTGLDSAHKSAAWLGGYIEKGRLYIYWGE